MDDANTTSCREVAAATQTRICLALGLIQRKCSHTSIKARRLSSSVFFPISCPHTEERLFSEEEEARASRFKEFRGN